MTTSAVDWLDAMSPWPRGGFGLERMRALLAELGDPQHAYPAIHVVGTNGKSTATVTIEQLLLSDGSLRARPSRRTSY
jgi:dihydrofolate synthase/folylpolyglutamate synthase